MATSKLQIHLLVFIIIGLSIESNFVTSQDMCSKFNIGGPCLMLQPPINVTDSETPPSPMDDPYCRFACSQGESHLFDTVCHCSTNASSNLATTTPLLSTTTTPTSTTTTEATTTTTTTTTTMPTTTPLPVTCYYSSNRTARLRSISKRMYSSLPVVTECDYPGVVGLYYENKGQLRPACMASLLEEDLLLINEKQCLQFIKAFKVYVLADSYKGSKITKTVSVITTSAKKLDPTGRLNTLFTVRIEPKLTFNSECVQPVCVPNDNIKAKHINLDDCRMVGYGSTNDTVTGFSRELMEVKVKVNPNSIMKTNLTITRIDGLRGTSCPSDDGAPVICSHKLTDEWITVGVTVTTGNPCSQKSVQKAPVVTSLLQEATDKTYYNAIQMFKYADPNVFAKTSDQ